MKGVREREREVRGERRKEEEKGRKDERKRQGRG